MAYFTKENAKEFAVKAVEMRKKLAEERRLTLETLRLPTDDFRADALQSVRVQMRKILLAIDAELEKHPLNTKALSALAVTLASFEAMEQKLSMRAGPGSLKPTVAKQPKGAAFHAPPPADDVAPG